MSSQSLEEFVESVNGGNRLRIEHDFGGGFVRLRTSEAERRQAAQDIRNTESIVLELLRNARDAHAGNIYIAMSREGNKRYLTVIDDGDGIPESMHEHVFEPRVTSKLDTNHMDTWGMHGRGMALFSIRENADCAYVASSETDLGCSVHVETDVKRLSERTDQSSFPSFELSEDNKVNVRGPRNILRTACEFAIEARDSVSLYIGSPLEVASTLYAYGTSTLSAIDRAFCNDYRTLPLAKRLASAADPAEFEEIADDMGLSISQRSARRVLDGQIPILDPLLEQITIQGIPQQEASERKKGKGKKGSRKLKLSSEDSAQLASEAKRSFADIAHRYYLNDDVEPSIRVAGEKLVVSIPIVWQD